VNVGWIGVGKLGLPCALTLAYKGDNQVFTYDISNKYEKILDGTETPPIEDGLDELLKMHQDGFNLYPQESIYDVVEVSDIIFVAVQTPHDSRFSGDSIIESTAVDFEIQYLVSAVREVCKAAEQLNKHITLVVISTVLPGTSNRFIRPLLSKNVNFIYSPLFIAMSRVIPDYTNPEFVLVGIDDEEHLTPIKEVYQTIHDRPLVTMSVESAELAKVAYNCFISMKVVFGNMLMELCHKTGADSDDIVKALSHANDRIISPAYLLGGMGDSGGCHPRDNQAMSWLADKLDLSVDLMGFVSQAREKQSGWLADTVAHYHRISKLPIHMLGYAYKKNVALTDGSAALLLKQQLNNKDLDVTMSDFIIDGTDSFTNPQVFVITMNHDRYANVKFPAGSIVIDPWAYIPDAADVVVIRLGRKS
jgi:UDPglucose 6-dehydrogenase